MTPTQMFLTTGLATALIASSVAAQSGKPPSRKHTATEIGDVTLVPATEFVSPTEVSITVNGDDRIMTSNGMPAHAIGAFPNAGNPNEVSAQNISYTIDATPELADEPTWLNQEYFGIAVNGVPYEAQTAEFWQGDRSLGWRYDALGGAVPLGIDANYAHVQPTGAYHYHALPVGLLQELGFSADAHSPLVGWAADGFPIYALVGDAGDGPVQFKSSYQLKTGERPGGDLPTGTYDGTFNQDYEYVAGLGALDACNGAMTYSDEFPDGTYAYFITDAFPYMSRCWSGTPSSDFSKK